MSIKILYFLFSEASFWLCQHLNTSFQWNIELNRRKKNQLSSVWKIFIGSNLLKHAKQKGVTSSNDNTSSKMRFNYFSKLLITLLMADNILLLLMCLDNKKLSILGQTWQQIHGCIPEPKKSNIKKILMADHSVEKYS